MPDACALCPRKRVCTRSTAAPLRRCWSTACARRGEETRLRRALLISPTWHAKRITTPRPQANPWFVLPTCAELCPREWSATTSSRRASALSGLPLRQDIAVTGSINQQGDIQAIGGVNEKIEGFFDVCRIKGLTGTQGVMMPESNVEDLMLREDILEAVAAGKFHIWPVAKVEQGIEILTGKMAGQRNGDRKFDAGTVFALIDERLRDMAKTLKEFE